MCSKRLESVVIKYVPYVGDSKSALDEYTSKLMLSETNTLVLHDTCEDSFLATPVMVDLVLLKELCQCVSFYTNMDPEPQGFHTVLSVRSFLFRALLVLCSSPVAFSASTAVLRIFSGLVKGSCPSTTCC